MTIPRRSLLLGAAAIALGSAASCTPPDRPFDPEKAAAAVAELVQLSGRDAFQQVRFGDGSAIGADLLMVDGSVRTYSRYSDTWESGRLDPKSILTSPASRPAAELPIDQLNDFARAAGPAPESIAFRVDYVGRLRISAHPTDGGEPVGILPDASGPVSMLDPEVAVQVTNAIREIVADYGNQAEQVGSFNGFVHVDAKVDGADVGVRIVRYPTIAAIASIADQKPFAADLLFDPSDFEPSLAISLKPGIAAAAKVKGTVWDWQYRRPEPGKPPMLSFGIGPDVPSTRVWVDESGTVVAKITGDCKGKSGFCPG